MLPLQTSGGEGRRWWFINGEPLEAAGARTTLMLDKPGEWQLVVMDEAGQTAAASFTPCNNQGEFVVGGLCFQYSSYFNKMLPSSVGRGGDAHYNARQAIQSYVQQQNI